jgi:hypothetical protein
MKTSDQARVAIETREKGKQDTPTGGQGQTGTGGGESLRDN